MKTIWVIVISAIAALAVIGVAAALVFNGDGGDVNPDEQAGEEAAADGEAGEKEEDPKPKSPAALELETAWADPGGCRSGEAETGNEECHRVELFVEAHRDEDFDVTMMSWRAEDDKGETHTPTWVEEPMQVFAGDSRTITLWFDLDDETELSSVQHLDTETTIELPDYWTPQPAPVGNDPTGPGTQNGGPQPGEPQPMEDEAEPEQDPVY